VIKGKVSRDEVAGLCVALLGLPAAADTTFEIKSTIPFSQPWQVGYGAFIAVVVCGAARLGVRAGQGRLEGPARSAWPACSCPQQASGPALLRWLPVAAAASAREGPAIAADPAATAAGGAWQPSSHQELGSDSGRGWRASGRDRADGGRVVHGQAAGGGGAQAARGGGLSGRAWSLAAALSDWSHTRAVCSRWDCGTGWVVD
jgi:hypothetical protein